MLRVSRNLLFILLIATGAASAQSFSLTPSQLEAITTQSPFTRFEDGRPQAPDALIERLKPLTAEDAYAVLPNAGYRNQFAGGFVVLHLQKKLLGRVVTAQFLPERPDMKAVTDREMKARGMVGNLPPQFVLDRLQPGDVLVVDMGGKVEGGTFGGNNFLASVLGATRTGGVVIDGGIRDLEGVSELDMAAYFRGAHPTAISNLMLTGYNVPIRIGGVTVLPGDIAFGDKEGVYFIPPHLLQQVVERGEDTLVHDEWTKEKLLSGRYKSSDIYPLPRDPVLKAEYEAFRERRLKEIRRGR